VAALAAELALVAVEAAVAALAVAAPAAELVLERMLHPASG